MADPSLVLVSNRGPVTFGPDGEIRRGTGGLVTALIGLATHREVTWVASAMSDEDVAVSEQNNGRPFVVHTPMLFCAAHRFKPPDGRPLPMLQRPPRRLLCSLV